MANVLFDLKFIQMRSLIHINTLRMYTINIHMYYIDLMELCDQKPYKFQESETVQPAKLERSFQNSWWSIEPNPPKAARFWVMWSPRPIGPMGFLYLPTWLVDFMVFV